MKVLYFIDSLGRGGAETQALDVCRNASRFGLDLTLVTTRSGPLEEEFRGSGVEFIKLERRFAVDLYLVSQLRKIIKERSIRIVHGYQAVEGIHIYLAARGLKVKKVLSYQGFVSDRKNRLTLKFLIPRMDANVAVSLGLQNWLAETDGLDTTRNFSVIYNGADPARLQPTGRSLREELGIDGSAILFGMTGNFYRDPRKDQLTICRALPKVFQELPKAAHCVFAGGIEPGAEDKMADCLNVCFENAIADRVHFLGSRSDIPDVLNALDVFVFSSLQEGLPVAVTEAMLAGVPMIVSDIEPLLEASGSGQYAEVFPVRDAGTLAEKMIELGNHADKRSALALRAKEFANDNFSIDAHFRELLKLYNSLL